MFGAQPGGHEEGFPEMALYERRRIPYGCQVEPVVPEDEQAVMPVQEIPLGFGQGEAQKRLEECTKKFGGVGSLGHPSCQNSWTPKGTR